MKYDDASWHSDGQFPSDSPAEYGGTHIGLFLRFCFGKGWAGELHREEAPEAIQAVLNGDMTGTEFLFTHCDGKFTDEDLNDEGNAIAEKYYGNHGLYLTDYGEAFEDMMYTASEREHDFEKFSKMIEKRLATGKLTE